MTNNLFIPEKSRTVPPFSVNWRAIEEWANNLSGGIGGLAWGINGPLVVTTAIPQPAVDGQIVTLVGMLAVAGSSDTVVALYQNGVDVGELTIPSGSSSANSTVVINTVNFDVMVPVLLTPGTGASDLSFTARYAS